MVSLNEKLQAKEMPKAPISDQNTEPLLPVDNMAQIPELPLSMKMEDGLSSGSGGSAVVDDNSPQLVMDSVDSCFPAENYAECMAAIDRVQPEEDGETYGWWVWS